MNIMMLLNKLVIIWVRTKTYTMNMGLILTEATSFSTLPPREKKNQTEMLPVLRKAFSK